MQKVSYMGNGTTKEFYFNFPYFEDNNIIVTKNNVNATGFCIIGTSAGTDADIPYTGGKVVFDVAPTALDNITIARTLPLTRVVDYQPLVKLNPTALNQDMNYMMEVMKDFNDELETFSIRYSELAESESTAVFLSRITTINQNVNEKATVAGTHATNAASSAVSANAALNQFNGMRTNCITEIPQDIKIELNAGTLTLKAGSKVYVPNGAGMFNTITTTVDKTYTNVVNGTFMLMYLPSGDLGRGNNSFSGTTAPATPSELDIWYDTANNVVKRYVSNWVEGYSFPLAIVTVSGGQISSIDQVFNGFGYIGSTVFALPGVAGLIANGRNADGTYKSTYFKTTSVLTGTPSNGTRCLTIRQNLLDFPGSAYVSYDSDKNYVFNNAHIYPSVVFDITTISSGTISSFNPRQVFHAVDYNDTNYIAHQAMPSARYTDVTLPASGSALASPADGYYTVSKISTTDDQYISIVNNTSGISVNQFVPNTMVCRVFIPVSKGDVLTVSYTLGGNTNASRFIYSNGAK